MYQRIIEHIDSEIDNLGIFDEIYGLAQRVTFTKDEEVKSYPGIYQKDGEQIQIDFNNAQSKIYAIRNGDSTIEEIDVEEHAVGCQEPIRVNTPIKYVGMVIRCYEDNQYKDEKIVHDIITKIYDADIRSILSQTKFEDIVLTVQSYSTDALAIWEEEFIGYDFKIGYDKIFFKVEFNIQVDLERNCWIQNYCYCE